MRGPAAVRTLCFAACVVPSDAAPADGCSSSNDARLLEPRSGQGLVHQLGHALHLGLALRIGHQVHLSLGCRREREGEGKGEDANGA